MRWRRLESPSSAALTCCRSRSSASSTLSSSSRTTCFSAPPDISASRCRFSEPPPGSATCAAVTATIRPATIPSGPRVRTSAPRRAFSRAASDSSAPSSNGSSRNRSRSGSLPGSVMFPVTPRSS
ncbi:hypothetical protein BE18_09870 [Sorangium cellulosum]|uniref:Uncharacterized protein n=1 Tax=Sorangium cellulosum TaxID=56 RepID=A0A150S231_SORCE|nr:hypothetical protein BE18_09870 [Sorangium cellulosum]